MTRFMFIATAAAHFALSSAAYADPTAPRATSSVARPTAPAAHAARIASAELAPPANHAVPGASHAASRGDSSSKPQSQPQVLELAPTRVVGRVDKPRVVIVLKTRSAAYAAAEAHAALHAALLRQMEPAALREADERTGRR